VGWAREFPRNQTFKIIIHAPEAELESEHADEVREALGRYFSYRSEVVGRDLNELFRVGRQSLLIGMAVLATCVLEGEPDHPRLGGKLEADRDIPVRLVAARQTPRSVPASCSE
jgi:hypothetical protein